MIALDAIYNLELLYIQILTLWCEVKKCHLQSLYCRCHANIIKTTLQYKPTLIFFTSIFINTMYSTYLAYNAVLVIMYNNSTI